MKHPKNRYERLVVNAKKKKHSFKGKEELRNQETANEIKTYRIGYIEGQP